VGDIERPAGTGDREGEKALGGGAAERRRGIENAGLRHPSLPWLRHGAGAEQIPRSFRPRGCEGGRELEYRGALKTDIRLPPRSLRATIPEPLVVDPEATGPPHPP